MESKWFNKGVTRAIAIATGSKTSTEYPTRDKHSQQDEEDFCKGFKFGQEQIKHNGIQSVAAYAEETEDENA